MGAPSSSCSSSTPSICKCVDAGSYTLTNDYTYCQEEFNQNNCCNKIGFDYPYYNQTYKAFNCFTPNATIIAQNSTLCNDPNSWVQPLKCDPVYSLYKTLGFLESEWIGSTSDTYCCGQNGIMCDFKNHVTGIDWSSKNKAGKRLLPDVFVEMNGLKSLSLSGNMLYGSIPASITNLISLEYLNLSHNAFTGPIAEIQFTKLSNIQVLDISYNKLGDSVPNTLANLTNLKDLSIGNNRFSGSIPNNLLSRNVTVKYTQYNSSKPTEAAIANNRRKKFLKFMLKSRDVFDQAAIASVGEIQLMCPKPYSRALTNLYRSYWEINQNASSAIENMNSLVSSKAAATQVKKTLIAAYKVGIFASSIFCRGERIWGYNGIEKLYFTVGLYGSERWNIQYPSCAAPNQSPVNFETQGSELYETFTNSKFALYSSVIPVNAVLDHGNTSIASQKKVSIHSQDLLARLQIGENIYSLFMSEIHTSSEHRIEGKDFVAEAQFYFRKRSPESIKAELGNSSIYFPNGPYFGNYSSYYGDQGAHYSGNYSSYYGDQGGYYSGNYSSYYGDQSANYSGNYSSYYGDQALNYSGNYFSYFSNVSYTEGNSSSSMSLNYSSYFKTMLEYYAESAQNMSISFQALAQTFSNFTNYAIDSTEFFYANDSYHYYTNMADSLANTSSYYRNLSVLAPNDLIYAMINLTGAGSGYSGNYSSFFGDQVANYSGNYSSYFGDHVANYSGNYSSYYGDQALNYSGNYFSYVSNVSYTEGNSSSSMSLNYSSYFKTMLEYYAENAQNMSIYLRDTAQTFSNFTKYAIDSSESYYAHYSYNYYTNMANSLAYTSSYYRYLLGLAPNDLIYVMNNSPGAGLFSNQDQMQSAPILPSGRYMPYPYCFLESAKDYDVCKVRFNGVLAGEMNEQPEEIVAIGALVEIADESSDFISQVANAYSSPYFLFKLDYSSVFSKIQNSSSFYSYKGSYTSPPCYKNIKWLVSTSELLTISVEDLKKIQQVQGYNSRETQPFGPDRESDIFNKK